MTVLNLVPKDDPILKTKLEPFDWVKPPTDPIQLAKDLTETMLFNNGLGLAANQVGLPHRVFVIKSDPIICAFNPIIVDQTEDETYLDEGCLSAPQLFLKIKRPKIIRVRFTMPNTEVVTEKYIGMTARVFLHEIDHLNGIFFTQRVSKLELEIAMRKTKKSYGIEYKLSDFPRCI